MELEIKSKQILIRQERSIGLLALHQSGKYIFDVLSEIYIVKFTALNKPQLHFIPVKASLHFFLILALGEQFGFKFGSIKTFGYNFPSKNFIPALKFFNGKIFNILHLK